MMFRVFTFWLVFHPGTILTSTPTLWPKSNTWWADTGRDGVGLCRCTQMSQWNLRASAMASLEPPAFVSTLTRSLLSGWPRLLCNFFNVTRICSGVTSSAPAASTSDRLPASISEWWHVVYINPPPSTSRPCNNHFPDNSTNVCRTDVCTPPWTHLLAYHHLTYLQWLHVGDSWDKTSLSLPYLRVRQPVLSISGWACHCRGSSGHRHTSAFGTVWGAVVATSSASVGIAISLTTMDVRTRLVLLVSTDVWPAEDRSPPVSALPDDSTLVSNEAVYACWVDTNLPSACILDTRSVTSASIDLTPVELVFGSLDLTDCNHSSGHMLFRKDPFVLPLKWILGEKTTQLLHTDWTLSAKMQPETRLPWPPVETDSCMTWIRSSRSPVVNLSLESPECWWWIAPLHSWSAWSVDHLAKPVYLWQSPARHPDSSWYFDSVAEERFLWSPKHQPSLAFHESKLAAWLRIWPTPHADFQIGTGVPHDAALEWSCRLPSAYETMCSEWFGQSKSSHTQSRWFHSPVKKPDALRSQPELLRLPVWLAPDIVPNRILNLRLLRARHLRLRMCILTLYTEKFRMALYTDTIPKWLLYTDSVGQYSWRQHSLRPWLLHLFVDVHLTLTNPFHSPLAWCNP